MSDGLIPTGATGIDIDNTVVGTSAYRQRVVIGGDNSSVALAAVSTAYPSTDAYGLNVRVIGSSGDVLGLVGLSSDVTLSSGTRYLGTVVGASSGVVSLTTTSIVGLTTTSLVGLSSSIQNYITNSTTVPVYLGLSTANIVGIVGLSSAVTLSSGALYLGTVVSASSGVIGLTTTSVVGLTTNNTIGFTSATLDLISGTTGNKYLPVRLTDGSTFYTAGSGGAGSTVVDATLSSGTRTIGDLDASTAVIGTIGGVVAIAGFPTAVSSGNQIAPMFDKFGRQVIIEAGPPDLVGSTFSAITANTSMTQLVSAPGSNLLRDLLGITIYSTAGTTALGKTTVMLFSSSGQAEPGVWAWQMIVGPTQPPIIHVWDRALPQLTANNPWYIVSTSSAVTVRAFAHYVTRST